MKNLLANKVFQYDEVAKLVSEHLSLVENLQEFCKQHNLEYNTVVLIKNNYRKQFPRVLERLMEIFDYKIEKVTAFRFSDK